MHHIMVHGKKAGNMIKGNVKVFNVQLMRSESNLKFIEDSNPLYTRYKRTGASDFTMKIVFALTS